MPTYIKDAGSWKDVSGGSPLTINDVGSVDQVLYKNASNVATGSVNLTFNGTNLSCNGDITAYASSDQRLKDNITSIPNALNKVLSISGNTFDWNEKSDKDGNDVGIIAQEILEVLPEAVITRDTGYLAVRYEKIIPLLIEAIKEQQGIIKNLQNRIEILEGN